MRAQLLLPVPEEGDTRAGTLAGTAQECNTISRVASAYKRYDRLGVCSPSQSIGTAFPGHLNAAILKNIVTDRF